MKKVCGDCGYYSGRRFDRKRYEEDFRRGIQFPGGFEVCWGVAHTEDEIKEYAQKQVDTYYSELEGDKKKERLEWEIAGRIEHILNVSMNMRLRDFNCDRAYCRKGTYGRVPGGYAGKDFRGYTVKAADGHIGLVGWSDEACPDFVEYEHE